MKPFSPHTHSSILYVYGGCIYSQMTGLNLSKDRIIEVAAMLTDGSLSRTVEVRMVELD